MEAKLTTRHHIKIVRLGDRQTIQLPPEFELPGEEAEIFKVAGQLIIRPVKRKTLAEVLESLEPIDEELPEIEDPPPDPVKI